MEDMRYDMAGSAIGVYGLFMALALNKVKINAAGKHPAC